MTKATITGSTTSAAINYLLMIGFNAWQNNTTGVYDPVKKIFRKPKRIVKGAPDVEAVDWFGRYVGVEIKTKLDRLSADQTIFAAETIGRWGSYCIISDITDLIKSLQFYGYKINNSGHVISQIKTARLVQEKIIANDIISVPNIPNANKIRNLSQIEKARISAQVKGDIGRKLVGIALGNYSGRML